MDYKHAILYQLNYEQLVKIARTTLIGKLPSTNAELIKQIIEHEKAFGESEVVEASSLQPDDFILMKINIPSFSSQTKVGWAKLLRCYSINAEEEDIINFFGKYSNVFITNQPHIELLDKISKKIIYIEAISSLAVGNKTINCQAVVRAKVLPSLKFVRKI